MKFLITWAGVLALAANALAQSPAGAEDARSDRVSSYLRSGQYADARRLIDEILRTEARADLRNVLAVFGSSPNMRVRRAPANICLRGERDGRAVAAHGQRKARGLADRHRRQCLDNQRCRGGEARSRDSCVGRPRSRPRRRQHRRPAGDRQASLRRAYTARRCAVPCHAGGSDAVEGVAAREAGHRSGFRSPSPSTRCAGPARGRATPDRPRSQRLVALRPRRTSVTTSSTSLPTSKPRERHSSSCSIRGIRRERSCGSGSERTSNHS